MDTEAVQLARALVEAGLIEEGKQQRPGAKAEARNKLYFAFEGGSMVAMSLGAMVTVKAGCAFSGLKGYIQRVESADGKGNPPFSYEIAIEGHDCSGSGWGRVMMWVQGEYLVL